MGAVHVDPGEDREAHAIIFFAEGADLGCGARFLSAELVAWKAQHHEAAVFIGAIELLQGLHIAG